MGDKTQIEWADASWNPVTGCSHVSDGCTHCYAERLSARFGWTTKPWGAQHVAENVKLHPDRLDWPMRWRRPRRIFVCSMADLFHERVPGEFIDEVFVMMALASRHTFLLLTKRPERMRDYLTARHTSNVVLQHWQAERAGRIWPPRNIQLGVSCEDQRRADERIPLLLQTSAAVRFVSCEPLLGPIDLTDYLTRCHEGAIDWVIVGGESGGPPERRLVERCRCWDPDGYKGDCRDCYGTGCAPKDVAIAWVRSLRDQCQTAGVPFFLKGWGGSTPRSGGALLDDREWRECPAELEATA